MSVLSKYSVEIRENKEIYYKGLTLKPLKVRQYALYRIAQDSFEIFQASLSPQIARLSWFSALDALDRYLLETTGKTFTYLLSAVMVFKTAMGLGEDSLFKVQRNPKGNISLVCIQTSTGSSPVMLSMEEMSELRQIIAAQNGYEIPDENWTIELYRAHKKLQEVSDNLFDWNIEDVVCSVAVNAGMRINEVWDLSIKEFNQIQKAIDRKLGYLVCSLSENMGHIAYKNGNPYPTWKLERKGKLPNGFKTIDEVEGAAGEILNSPDMI